MSPLRGVLFKLGSVVLFVVMAALIKASASEVPAGEAVFFRSIFALPVILGWLVWRGNLATGLRTRDPLGHLWRGLIGVTSMGCTFAALGKLPLPEVTAIGYAAPLMTVLFGVVLLGERIRAFRISAVVLGLCGVTIVLWPRLSLEEVNRAAMIGVGLVLLASVCRALAQIQVRRLVQSEETAAIVFYFSVTSSVFALMTAPFGWTWPGAGVAAMLVAAGLIGGLAQILLTTSYRHGEAGLLAPFDYASILFALAIGYVVFDEVPTG